MDAGVEKEEKRPELGEVAGSRSQRARAPSSGRNSQVDKSGQIFHCDYPEIHRVHQGIRIVARLVKGC